MFVGITEIKLQPYCLLYDSHILIPAILAIAYGSFVSSNNPVNKDSSLRGCGASFG